MKITLLLLFGFCTGFSCRHTYVDPGDYADQAPRFTQIQGVYYGRDTSNKSILCLSGYGWGFYFILNRGNVVRNGKWDYHPAPGKGSDYTIGPPGYGRIDFDRGVGKEWSSYTFFEGSGSERKLIIDSLFTFTRVKPSFLDSLKYGYEKLMRPYERK